MTAMDSGAVAPTADALAPVRAKQRSVWIDVLRGALVLVVVAYHAYYGAVTNGAPVPEWLHDTMRALEPVRMPVLVMLSGMFLPRALAKGTRRYVEGKVSALVVPYVLWFALFYFVLLAGTHQPSDHWYVEIHVPQTPLWFICYLIGFFALALPLRTPALRLAALAGSLYALHAFPDRISISFVFFFACFLTGSLISEPPKPLGQVKAWLRGRRLTALTLLATYPTWFVMHEAVRRDWTDRTVTWLSFAVCALLVGRVIAQRIAPSRAGQWLASLGPYTIVIFLTHTALLAAFPVPSRSLTFGAVDSWWLSLAIAMAFSLGCVSYVRRHEAAWLAFDVRRGLRALTATREQLAATPLWIRSEGLRVSDRERYAAPAAWASFR